MKKPEPKQGGNKTKLETLVLGVLATFNKHSGDIKLFLLILLVSFLLSLLLLIGKIDQDFFSFYYIGRGISRGMEVYADFADNKGPVLHLFFALLNRLFGANYSLALITASTVIDSLSVFILLKLVSKWFDVQISTNRSKLLIILATALYKSFSIGAFMGGFYSESLTVFFIAYSLWWYENNKPSLSAILFVCSVLTRPTILVYLLVYLGLKTTKRKYISLFKFVVLVSIFTSASLVLYSFFGDLLNLFDNVAVFSINYSKAVQGLHFGSILLGLLMDTRLVVLLAFCFLVLIFFLRDPLSPGRQKKLLLLLWLSSLGSVFSGGIFYFHHFLQFSVVVFASIFISTRYKNAIKSTLLGLVALFLLMGYLSYIGTTEKRTFSKLPKNAITDSVNKKYWVVVTYYPEYYTAYNKTSPDRYYQSFYLSAFYNDKNEVDVAVHEKLDSGKLKDTLFLFVYRNSHDKKIGEEYLSNFKNKFKLVESGRLLTKMEEVHLYVSE